MPSFQLLSLRRALPVLAGLTLALLAGCEKEPYDELYTTQEDAGFATLRGLVTTSTKIGRAHV